MVDKRLIAPKDWNVLNPADFATVGAGDDTNAFNLMSAYVAGKVGTKAMYAIQLEAGREYTLSDTWQIDTGLSLIDGMGASIVWPALSGGKAAIETINHSTVLRQPTKIQNMNILGIDTATGGRDSNNAGLRLNSAVNSNVNGTFENMMISGFGKGILLGSRAYHSHLYEVDVRWCGTALSSEAGATDNAESVSAKWCKFYQCDEFIDLTQSAQIVYMDTCQLDHYGDPTRVLSKNRIANLANASQLTLRDCHCEWTYGNVAGQTVTPFKVNNGGLNIRDGVLLNPGATYDPLYAGIISSAGGGLDQIDINGLDLVNMGKVTKGLKDMLIVPDSGAYTGLGPRVRVRGIKSRRQDMADLPAGICYLPRTNALYDGGAQVAKEFANRCSVSGSAVVTPVSMPHAGIASPLGLTGSNTGVYITGQGIVRLALQNERYEQLFWSFFLEGSLGTGTLKIREADYAGILRVGTDGATAAFAADDRVSYKSNDLSITLGSAGWRHVSFKDVYASPRSQVDKRLSSTTVVEFDTLLMSAGGILIPCFGA